MKSSHGTVLYRKVEPPIEYRQLRIKKQIIILGINGVIIAIIMIHLAIRASVLALMWRKSTVVIVIIYAIWNKNVCSSTSDATTEKSSEAKYKSMVYMKYCQW